MRRAADIMADVQSVTGGKGAPEAEDRIRSLLETHLHDWNYSSEDRCAVFSSPGRVELAGNHTDHNGGTVFAGAVDLDILAAVSPTEDGLVRLRSDIYPGVIEATCDDTEPRKAEAGAPVALLRGVLAGFRTRGAGIGGFRVSLSSRVLPGSGLSSSAAFEVLLARICTDLFDDEPRSPLELARIGQEAEHRYFGKPCGLMDQLACAVGGALFIDFARNTPELEPVDFNFTDYGFSLFIISTGSGHENLGDHYARVRMEMESAARMLGKKRLRDVNREELLKAAETIRSEGGDRMLLRALHFFDEQERLERLRRGAKGKDVRAVLREMEGSGKSSCMYLQNCRVDGNRLDQGIVLACYMAEKFLRENNLPGAVRVHGGGFAGTVLACIPSDAAVLFAAEIESMFGAGAVMPIGIRASGAGRVF